MTPGVKTVVQITIDNTRNADLVLPITGAEGTAALMGLAAVIAASGAVVLVRVKRRENAEVA